MATDDTTVRKSIQAAARAILDADALIITAGAGMGVDSGLPDFRGPKGFWRAYPPLKEKGLKLEEISTPHWFNTDPAFAWGFFAHRYNLYKTTEPHSGFSILRKWTQRMRNGYYVFTSNVDGQFQKAGFPVDHVVEWHGTIHCLQLCDPAQSRDIWPVPDDLDLQVDLDSLLLTSELPMGPPAPGSGSEPMAHLARPNIKMFSDETWVPARTMKQKAQFDAFFVTLDENVKLVVFEVGSGVSVPKIRKTSEEFVRGRKNATLIRVNPKDWDIPQGHILLPLGGLEAISLIDKEISRAENAK